MNLARDPGHASQTRSIRVPWDSSSNSDSWVLFPGLMSEGHFWTQTLRLASGYTLEIQEWIRASLHHTRPPFFWFLLYGRRDLIPSLLGEGESPFPGYPWGQKPRQSLNTHMCTPSHLCTHTYSYLRSCSRLTKMLSNAICCWSVHTLST